MEKALEFGERPVLCLCRSWSRLESLVKGSKSISKGREFVLLMDYGPSLVKRMLPAFINARLRMSDGIARSRSAQMEMLLLACGTMNIGKALKEHGAKDQERFLVFATSGGALRKFVSNNKVEILRKIQLTLDEDVAGDVALTESSGS